MTIEIYQRNREKPIIVKHPNFFEAVDGATNLMVLLKALPDSKGFLVFHGSYKRKYEEDRKKNENIDNSGTVFNAGDAIQLVDGVIAVGS